MASFIELQKRFEDESAEPVLDLAPEVRKKAVLDLPLIPKNRSGSAPLSFAQQRLWFLDQINPDNPASNISRAVRISGSLNEALLKQCLQEIVNRHESLRTTFATTQLYAGVDSTPVQLIAETRDSEFSMVDLSQEHFEQRETMAKDLARAEAQRPFDLTLGPLMRATLVRLEEQVHVLVINHHRIVSDDESLEVLFRELWHIYGADKIGNGFHLPELPVQYAAYAAWQQGFVDGKTGSAAIEYWRKKLQGAPAVLELPIDRARPVLQTWHGATYQFVLGCEVTRNLRALCENENVPLFLNLLTAFQILISRYSGQRDIVIGSSCSNRELEETRHLIGPLSNPLAWRKDFSANGTFREHLRLGKSLMREVEAHKEMPFERLIEELKVERSLSTAPIFQVAFEFKQVGALTTNPGKLLIEEFDFESGITRLDLTLQATETPQHLNCRFEYNTDLFEKKTVETMARHFEVFLEVVATNPDQPVAYAPLLTGEERHRLLVEWNDTSTFHPQEQRFSDLFEAQVAATPKAIALVQGTERLTFRELNRRANQVGHFLRRQGIGPENVVGVYLPRSTEMVVSLLGIVKAGAAYLPLDTANPPERLSLILADAGVSLLLTNDELRQTLATDTRVICIDHDAEVARESTTNTENSAVADNLVYVIYTSGSSGVPKGVMITHRGLVNYLNWACKNYLAGEAGESLVHSPLAFDLTVTSLLVPLIRGQTVHLLADDKGLEGLALALRSASVACLLKITPAHLEGLGYLLAPEEMNEKVRTIVVGGEALPGETIRFWRNAAPRVRFINEYGPTETVVGCCAYEVAATDMLPGVVPIGRPISHTELYVLDECLQPVPVGVTGMLYVGGLGVARGYLNRPWLTAESFLPNPFSREPGKRLYRTGDLVRYLPDGNLVFLGRADDQVKVRGYRIELGEIQELLCKHPTVKQGVVVLQDAGNKLIAYVVMDSKGTATKDDLNRFLSSRLPEYMVPAIVMLEELPLTINGKVDRQALARLQSSRSDAGTEHVGPRDEIEKHLVKIWEVVLGLPSVGVRDNFFDLGGHSLLAARLFAQIENRFGTRVPLATLFQSPTVAQLADVLREKAPAKEWSSLVAIQPNGSRPPLFCIHAAGANVLIYRPLSRHLGPDQPVYALQARGLDGRTKPLESVEDMANQYIREMRIVQPTGPYFLLGASFGGLVVFEMAHQLLAQGQTTALLAMLNTNCPVYSLPHRIRCHVGHLIQWGPKRYLISAYGALTGRLVQSSAGIEKKAPLDQEIKEALETRLDMNDPLVRTILAVLRAGESYVPKGKIYPGRITLFWANEAAQDFEDNRRSWGRLAAGGFEIHVVPGSHTSMREEPHVRALAEELIPCLTRPNL